jgi:tRNA/rRNA methyltransferase
MSPDQSPREELLRNLSVVLARPAFAGNVGSVARAMSNFGVREGKVVAPRCDLNHVEARQFATGPAAVILATMTTEKNLPDAVASCATVIGLTRRAGKFRKPTLAIDEISPCLASGKTAIVLGPEESGLTDEDLSVCTHVLTLDVSPVNPSLNLSHAVAVVLSAIYRELGKGSPAPGRRDLVASSDYQLLSKRLRELVASLEVAGHLSHGEHFAELLARSFQRSRCDSDDMRAWHGFVSAVEKSLGPKRGNAG